MTEFKSLLFYEIRQNFHFILSSLLRIGLPRWLSGKESTCNAGDTGDIDSIPGSGRSPGVGNGNQFQYPCLKNSIDREVWRATVHGVPKNQT